MRCSAHQSSEVVRVTLIFQRSTGVERRNCRVLKSPLGHVRFSKKEKELNLKIAISTTTILRIWTCEEYRKGCRLLRCHPNRNTSQLLRSLPDSGGVSGKKKPQLLPVFIPLLQKKTVVRRIFLEG